MPHFLIQGSYTAETWAKMIQNPQNRMEAVRPVVESMGGKLEAFYFAFGDSDFFVIAELPDTMSEAALALATIATGAFRSLKTTVLLTPEEAMEAMRKASQTGYRPPS